jgi:hypothetical protein
MAKGNVCRQWLAEFLAKRLEARRIGEEDAHVTNGVSRRANTPGVHPLRAADLRRPHLTIWRPE